MPLSITKPKHRFELTIKMREAENGEVKTAKIYVSCRYDPQ